MSDMQALRKELADTRAALREAMRDRQVAEGRDAEFDRRALVAKMREGAFIQFPDDEPTLGIKAGDTMQKSNGKLVRVQTLGGIPVKHSTSNHSSRSLDFATELKVQKARKS